MTTIVTRAGKGSALTWDEMDDNFTNLNTDLVAAEADIITAQATADNHIADTTAAHNATAIEFTPASGIAATTVAGALAEIGDTIGSTGSIGFRNRIINGDMRIDQRNAGAAITGTGLFPVDRWVFHDGGTGAIQGQRITTTPPAGYSHLVRLTATTADTAAAAEYYLFQQKIEGLNVVDLAWGTADAQSITVSFKVRSSLTGTFTVGIQNSAANRTYLSTFTISAANTWERKTITIPGDTSGTWLTDTGVGLALNFDLGSGTDYQTAAGAWTAGNYLRATGATAFMATLNATFDLTGVQLEVGTVATPFERRPYADELRLCMRYYEKVGFVDQSVAPAAGLTCVPRPAVCWNNTNLLVNGVFLVPKRTDPNITTYRSSSSAGTDTRWNILIGGAWANTATTSVGTSKPHEWRVDFTHATPTAYQCHTVDGGLTASAEF